MNKSAPGGPIVLGIDGSTSALDAVRWAARESRFRSVPLKLIHASNPDTPAETVFGAPDVDGDYARQVLGAAVDAAANAGVDRVVDTVVLRAGVTETMVAESASSTMVVMGDSRASAIAVLALGSTVLAVVASASCPVAVVRDFVPERVGPVVVGLGRTDADVKDSVAMEAFRFAANHHAEVTAVHANTVAGNLVHATGRAGRGSSPDGATGHSLAPFIDAYPAVQAQSHFSEAGPGAELVSMSRGAQLVVLGHRRGHTCGTTLITVLRHSHCPVLVVPHD